MLDLQFVRANLDLVRESFEKRKFPLDGISEFEDLDAQRREVIREADEINRQRNASSKEIGALMQSGDKEAAEAKKSEVAGLKATQQGLEQKRSDVESKMRELLSTLPNIPADDVPIGDDEEDNVEVSRFGSPTEFAF